MEGPIVLKNNKNQQLVGILHKPKTKKKVPLVIVCHGFWASKTRPRFVELGRELEKNDIATLRFDFAGCGDSQGDFKKTNLYDEIKDLESVYKFVKKLKFINKNKIGIYAESFGTIVATLFINKHSKIKTLVLLAPALNQKYLIKSLYTREEIKFWKKNNYLDIKKGRVGIKWLTAVENKDFSNEAEKIKMPTLVVFGSKDKVVPLKESKKVFQKIKSYKKLIEIKNGDHTFMEHLPKKELIKVLTSWFKKCLK